MMLGLTGLMIAYGTSFAASDDNNYATQLELKNCGGYGISRIDLQRKAAGEGYWTLIDSWKLDDIGMTIGQSFCVDMRNYREFKNGDQGRLKGSIVHGETKKCDGAIFGESKKGRRKMEIAGSNYKNNNCQTLNFISTRPPSQCEADRSIHDEEPCS